MLNLVMLNVYILNKHYRSEKLTQDEYRDKIVKYLLAEGLKTTISLYHQYLVGDLGNIIKLNTTRKDCVNGIFLLASPRGG